MLVHDSSAGASLRQHDSVFAERSRVQKTKRGARPERLPNCPTDAYLARLAQPV
jgi:hypothetical protein